MKQKSHRTLQRFAAITFFLALFACLAGPAMAGAYPALDGVKGLDSVFDFILASPKKATGVFPAIKGVHEDESVRALAAPPRTVIVFHGGATRLISTDRSAFDTADHEALDKVATLIREFKQAGIKMEVCMYAVKVLGIDPATLMPEIDQVGNGFISILGYQAQGYSLVTVP